MAISANELMIGNWVSSIGFGNIKVHAISNQGFVKLITI